jgi:outer membrane lipoprotein-sorting protein
MITGADKPLLTTLRAVAFVLLLNFCPLSAGAPASPSSWSLEVLMQDLAQVKSARARFVERKFLRILNDPLELRGTLSYSAPGHLEKHTLTPKRESLVLDQDRLTLEDEVRKQRRTLALQEYPVISALVESIRATLAGDLQSLNRFYQVRLEGDPREWRLILTPRDSKMKAMVTDIRMTGTRRSVRVIEVNEAGGDRSEMTIIQDKE